ncbi:MULTISPECIES: nucleoid occlusion protein [Exiguobacterium]|uniref:Nucleoid occlusion protein n=1 Tax=Exiguobacterium aestuarii TaxID=273527 RepID=A0ABW2PR27_9BACL|nr:MULTISPECIES: nucleoid occlusion protein [Exiguobacterium]MCA0981932.1 nucleoid occlusion protein [Exiguobacterium aestuarii]MCT4787654.1 nucleoid occlusion protein [Exiguobacterium aestuarii]MDA5561206.1 nucleoid occlusion protein [Exiguobacterium sp. MMG028]MDE0562893.1 nucleoid occlusion protein [Exiguobacterium sp. B2(2022)]
MKNRFAKLFGVNRKDEVAVTQIAEVRADDTVQELSLSRLRPNRYQPRKVFEPAKIEELATTISEHGLLQPIVVRKADGDCYEIIAGERRFRAVKSLGWSAIPAIVRDMDDDTTAALALIENLQREQLSPIEEAEAYDRLLALNGLTQDALAKSLGKSQSTIANKLRLLKLPEDVKQSLRDRRINERHARALLPLKEEGLQLQVLVEVLEQDYNVKETEERVAFLTTPIEEEKRKPKKQRRRTKSFARDTRIAINTIRDSIDLIGKTGIDVQTEEVDEEEFVEIRIRIPKARPQK